MYYLSKSSKTILKNTLLQVTVLHAKAYLSLLKRYKEKLKQAIKTQSCHHAAEWPLSILHYFLL